MRFEVITIFPEYFKGPLGIGILRRAIEKRIIEVNLVNPRDFAQDSHRIVDDAPFGGGGGMIMKPEPLVAAIESVREGKRGSRTIALTPQGRLFNQEMAQRFSELDQLILVCGRYEGVDERVFEHFCDELVSIGDYVLPGGEVAALVIIEAVTRLIKGVVGNPDCVREDSFSRGLLDYPQYTRPRVFRGIPVPEVLLSGDHKRIREWRMRESIRRTLERRPELINEKLLTDEERRMLQEIRKEVENE